MFSLFRAGVSAALLAVASLAANAAEKPFQNSDLADSAIKLEAQIKSDAGTPTKPLPQIRRDADAAFAKNDFRTGMALLGQIVAAAPNDGTTWLRLARTIMQIRPADEKERTLLLERASTAAYIAYQRTTSRNEEADSLALLGNVLEPAPDMAPGARCVAAVARTARGRRRARAIRAAARAITASACSTTPSMPIPPRRAPVSSSPKTCRRAPTSRPSSSLAGTDKPALSVAEKQLCVEGLKHGETYTVTLRAGLPSVVHETLSKSADFSIYVRDRKPLVRFSTTAYVLPRIGQRGIPVISVNTRAVAVEIYRIGDRNLIDAIAGGDYGRGDFQRSLDRYDVEQLANSRGVPVWKGELAVEPPPLNAEVTTAFPVDQAVGDLKPGVYVMVAQPQETEEPRQQLRFARDAVVHRFRSRPDRVLRQ